MQVYKYLFYKLYAWQSHAWGNKAIPELNALFLVVLVILCNILLLVQIVGLCLRVHQPLLPNLSKLQAVLALIVIGVPQYFILVYKGRYRQIASEFDSESQTQRRRGSAVVALYMIFSYVLLVVGSILRAKLESA